MALEQQRTDTYTVQKLYALFICRWRFEQTKSPEWVSVALTYLLTMYLRSIAQVIVVDRVNRKIKVNR